MIQGGNEWHEARLGKATASRIADIIAKTKSGPSTSRANYMAELICERLTGQRTAAFTNAAMEHGTLFEPVARQAYSERTGLEVLETGFVDHPEIAMSGASPDGLVRSDGLVEIKAPLTATHFDTLLTQTIPAKYITQMQWQMACTGAQWCDYVSFDPRVPEHMRLFIKRVPLDVSMVLELETEVTSFLKELEEKVTLLQIRYQVP